MKRCAWICCVAASTAQPGVAWAQLHGYGWHIDLDYGPGRNSISPANPAVRVTLKAYFSPLDYAMAGINVSALSAEPGWSLPRNLAPLTTGAYPGQVSPRGVTSIIGGQLNFPVAGIFADPSNPIAAWTADWTTQDFRRRSVELATDTVRFDLYGQRWNVAIFNRRPVVQEGLASIRIVPGPAAAAGLAYAVALCCRRHRR